VPFFDPNDFSIVEAGEANVSPFLLDMTADESIRPLQPATNFNKLDRTPRFACYI